MFDNLITLITMLENLKKCLGDLKKCMKSHEAILKGHEAATRMALIDPLLRVLGWDTDNPTLVIPEYPNDQERIDYALMGQNQKPVAVIEAKKLGNQLGRKERDQVILYATRPDRIPYAGLTDGDCWKLYDVFKDGRFEDRCIINISIKTDPLHECVLQLLSLWQPDLASDNPVKAHESLQQSLQQSLSFLHQETRTNTTERESTPPSDLESPLPEWKARSDFKRADRPTKIRFPNKIEKEIRSYWNEILVHTVDWLVEQKFLTDSKVPIRDSAEDGHRYIVNNKPVHSNGTAFSRNVYEVIDRNGTKLFVEKNYGTLDMLKNTEKLLRCCNKKPDEVWLLKDRGPE